MEWRIASPTGTTTLTAMLDDAGELRYRVDCDGATVITDARLGLFTATHDLTTRLVAVAATEPETIVDTFVLPHGKRRESTTTMTEQAVRFASADGTRFEIVMRAADDGVAFRYRSPDPWPPTLVVAEATELRFAAPGRAWIQQLQPPGHAEPAYEETFTNGTPLDDPGPSSGWFLPALFEVDGRWVLLTEADADAGYTLAQLAGPEDGTYRIAFPHPDEALGLGAAQPTVAGRWQTPWRVLAMVRPHPQSRRHRTADAGDDEPEAQADTEPDAQVEAHVRIPNDALDRVCGPGAPSTRGSSMRLGPRRSSWTGLSSRSWRRAPNMRATSSTPSGAVSSPPGANSSSPRAPTKRSPTSLRSPPRQAWTWPSQRTGCRRV